MKKTFLVVDSSYPINTRTQRFVDSLADAFGKGNVKVVAWNRDNKNVKDSDYYIYSKQAAYGNRLEKIKRIWGFRSYIKNTIKSLNPDVIIASHWDCLFLVSGLISKDTTLIYENLDIPTGNKIVRKILKILENRGLKKTTLITLASRFYSDKYASFKGQKFVIENKMPTAIQLNINKKSKATDQLNISFIGSIRYVEILKNLVDAVAGISNVTFHIFGGGIQLKEIEEYSKGNDNVVIHGPYKYNEIGHIYEQTDLVWAVYPSNDHNVKYAISNKYHECLHYGIPGFFAAHTCLADMVEAKGAGFAIDCYSVDNIRETIKNIVKSPILLENASTNLRTMKVIETDNWEDEVQPFIDYLKTILAD